MISNRYSIHEGKTSEDPEYFCRFHESEEFPEGGSIHDDDLEPEDWEIHFGEVQEQFFELQLQWDEEEQRQFDGYYEDSDNDE